MEYLGWIAFGAIIGAMVGAIFGFIMAAAFSVGEKADRSAENDDFSSNARDFDE